EALEVGLHNTASPSSEKSAGIYLLVERTPAEAKVKALVVSVLHRFHHLFGHPHREGEVAADLPHHDGGPDVLGLDLDVLALHLFGDLQAVGAVLVAAVLGAVRKGCWEFVHLSLVYFLLHALLKAFENDAEIQARQLCAKNSWLSIR
uniref:Uncharacterized protein n=1 Tax=Salvator merianae TaxID=96440 RepID=A0A8D0E9X0_SALMN